jgi:hypothetical protein
LRLCSLSVVSYDSQGYGRSIRTRVNTGSYWLTSQSPSHLATDGQSTSLFLYQTTNWDPRPIFISLLWKICSDICEFLLVVRSLTRGLVWNLSAHLLRDLASAVSPRTQSHRASNHNLLSHLRLTSLRVAFFNSQGECRKIRTRLHTGNTYSVFILKVKIIFLPAVIRPVYPPAVIRPVYPGVRLPSGNSGQFFFLAHGICLQAAAVLISLLWGAPYDESSDLSLSQSEAVVVSPLSVRIWVFNLSVYIQRLQDLYQSRLDTADLCPVSSSSRH